MTNQGCTATRTYCPTGRSSSATMMCRCNSLWLWQRSLALLGRVMRAMAGRLARPCLECRASKFERTAFHVASPCKTAHGKADVSWLSGILLSANARPGQIDGDVMQKKCVCQRVTSRWEEREREREREREITPDCSLGSAPKTRASEPFQTARFRLRLSGFAESGGQPLILAQNSNQWHHSPCADFGMKF